MKLEPANIVCPKCGNGNYMRHLIGKGVGKLDMKCINCNSYFNFDELYKQKIAEIVKPQTNADRIRSMTDEELAQYMGDVQTWGGCPNYGARNCTENCADCWLDWLKQEVGE